MNILCTANIECTQVSTSLLIIMICHRVPKVSFPGLKQMALRDMCVSDRMSLSEHHADSESHRLAASSGDAWVLPISCLTLKARC